MVQSSARAGRCTHDAAHFSRCKPFIAVNSGEKWQKRVLRFHQHFTFFETKASPQAGQWIAVDGTQAEWLRYGPKKDADRDQL
jgi:hypothetical protein